MIREDLLQFIWKHQYFSKSDLRCTDGSPLEIYKPGMHNANQGPDFLQAKIKIGQTTWAGNVEVHIQSDHWHLHAHTGDPHYENIILHVVWEHTVDIPDASGNAIPTLELQSRVSGLLLEKYRQLMHIPKFINCENQIEGISGLVLHHWKQRLVAERLIHRSVSILEDLKAADGHWEEVFWWRIAANFGIRLNKSVFSKIAQSLPVTILGRHKHNLLQIEAMVFGQAGLLERQMDDAYAVMLQKEYRFYQRKYSLTPVDEPLVFLRMRPANFPSVRLAQLAVLIYKSNHLFSKIKQADSLKAVREMFDVCANDYWHYHYVFDKETPYKEKHLGTQMINNIIINTVIPVLFAYGMHTDDGQFKDRAISWLEALPAEKNTILSRYENLSLRCEHAFDSQALLQLKDAYCNQHRCLQCAIGNAILKRDGAPRPQ